jgi:hypothetical protein
MYACIYLSKFSEKATAIDWRRQRRLETSTSVLNPSFNVLGAPRKTSSTCKTARLARSPCGFLLSPSITDPANADRIDNRDQGSHNRTYYSRLLLPTLPQTNIKRSSINQSITFFTRKIINSQTLSFQYAA